MPVDLPRMVEALLFAAGEPLTVKELVRTTETEVEALHAAIRTLRERYEDSALQIVEIAGGFQLATRPEYAPAVGKLLAPHANRLSRPALETVTIIAYRQPCTQAEIEAIRGVASDAVLKTLTERDMIREAGRKPTPGRPILYATTDAFLHYFGMAAIDDLPALDEDDEMMAEATEEATTALAAAGVRIDGEESSR